MGKCCKVLTWVTCAIAIFLALCVAIYFIVADAIDRKAESCMFKYFSDTGLLEKYNVAVDKIKINDSYSVEDCESFVDLVRKRTLRNIEAMNITDCMKTEFKGRQLESLMLKGVLDKFDRQREGANVTKSVFTSTHIACMATPIPA